MALFSHKRDTNARRKPTAVQLAGTVAVLVTGAAVVAGIATHDQSAENIVATDATPSVSASGSAEPSAAKVERDRTTSRSATRIPLSDASALISGGRTAQTARESATKKWTTDTLNLWSAPGKGAVQHGTVADRKVVYATGTTEAGRQEIVYDNDLYWVTSGYLADEKPKPEPSSSGGSATGGALSDAPCADSSVEHGLAPDTIRLYHAVCHAFPQVHDYLGWGPRSEHDTGHALDVMVYGDKALGDQIAAWAQAHATELNLYDDIWYDRIWTPVRSSEGWRDYGDHGSPTANHMDHVHLGTN